MDIARIEQLSDLIEICIREYKYASAPKTLDQERADQAKAGLAQYSAELTRLAA